MCEESARQKPLCYYVMNNGVVEEQQAMFEKPTYDMMYHLKPLFIRAKVDGFPMNKVFFDGGAAVNLMPQSFLKRIGKFNTDLKPHNMVLSYYEGKNKSHTRCDSSKFVSWLDFVANIIYGDCV